jgi:chorismate dehydratase
LYPIFYSLVKSGGPYEFTDGYPSMLNAMLRRGEIDVSPSSSIEYLRYPEEYERIEGHSISARDEIRSILFLSKYPIEELAGKNISSTHQSETSKALLEILLKKFYGMETPVQETELPLSAALSSFDAYLSIGDEALKAGQNPDPEYYTYDLGRLWHKFTGASFVFALWIARKDALKKKAALFERLKEDLDRAQEFAVTHLEEIAASRPIISSGIIDWLTPEELVSYWKIISFGLDAPEKKGLELFGKYAGELGLI